MTREDAKEELHEQRMFTCRDTDLARLMGSVQRAVDDGWERIEPAPVYDHNTGYFCQQVRK